MGSIAAVSDTSAGFSPFADSPLPRRVDTIAASCPERPWMIVPCTSDIHGEWRTINFGEFAKAVNGAARWIERTIGVAQDQRETVAYMGVNDVRYGVIPLALMKVNRRALLLSLRNSDEAQLHLLQRTDSTHYLYTEGIESHLAVFEDHSEDLHGHQVPTFDEMVALGEQGHFESQGDEGASEHVMVLHTSGSTGLPKPIYMTNTWVAQLDHQKYLKAPPGRKNRSEGWMGPTADGKPMFTAAPFYHTMGMVTMFRSIFTGPLVLPPLGKPASADFLSDILLLKKASVALFPPSMLEEMSETEKGLKALSTVDDIYFGGAPLAKEAGDRIRRFTRINSIIGSTEASLITALEPEDPADWEYFEWHSYSGVVMEDAGEGLYEQVIKPIVDLRYLSVFANFPEITEWRTKDLWEQHPTKTGLWRYKGRRDDVIVFSNGEKFNPVSFEKMVENHPLVKGAIVVGQSRFQPAILVEPIWSKLEKGQDLDYLLHELWPAIEEANKDAPAHAQVWKNKVAFTKKEKPFIRAPKGSIIRRATIRLYEPELEALYSNEGFDEQLGKLNKDADLPTARAFIRKAIALTVSEFQDEHSDDQDIFDLGVDSLQVMALASALSHALKTDAADRGAAVVPRDVYGNPTVNKLATALLSKLSQGDAEEKPAVPREQIMAEMVEKYTSDLPQTASPLPALPEKQTVILTGSTGSLGNYILEDLIASPDVAKVYCLNRSDSAPARQAQSFAEREVPADFSKVTFLRTDFSQARFGLSQEVYDELARTATIFIHNAWAVDFNHSLQSYEPTHIAGTRRVVDFSFASAHRAQITFISSIASVANWPSAVGHAGPVPEQFLASDSAPLPQGYGESKHVAGRILEHAATHSGVPVSIVRCGQLAGPRQPHGCWNRHEWLPSIVHSSKNMGVVPANLGNQDAVDWVPMDAAARTVVECTFARLSTREVTPLDVFHVINPRVVSWRSLVPVIQAFYRKEGRELKAVEFKEWMRELRAVPLTKEEVEAKPGVKLIDFYEGLSTEGGSLPPMETAHTVESSRCLGELKEVDGALFENWLKQWQF
ncbi:putative nrps-like enzyme [Neofusicoccum parvum]|uniref:Nrps-like enzyme n=1 Tax=Neofusicoccum parvum TaxID=310453 RepID=A0ACB5SQJ8_9PEZI|nr:putative nrps-like enzyme [Neofusicoccum parvum]